MTLLSLYFQRSSVSLLGFGMTKQPTMGNEVREALENGTDDQKVDAMRKAVMMLLNGEPISNIFITIVRYVLPSEDHTIQKLLLLYLEILEKTDSSGKLLPEMILICQNLRNNLQHANEYIRGCTLRFICRVQVYYSFGLLTEYCVYTTFFLLQHGRESFSSPPCCHMQF